jgi:adenylate kinase
VRHISSGEVLRAEIARATPLGRRLGDYALHGDLVPDELICDIMLPVVVAAVNETGEYLLDGFPRTVPQALRTADRGTDLGLSAEAVIYLTAPEHVLVSRLLARAERTGRADDAAEVIRHRLAVFGSQTLPLVEYYRNRRILHEINADRPEDDVHADLRNLFATETP